jgi:hypothetical protein
VRLREGRGQPPEVRTIMARKRADYDGDGDEYCLTGGEITTPGPVCPNDWQPSSECNDGTRDVSGSEYDYLGHFRQAKYLRQGHNDIVGGLVASGVGPGIDQNLLAKGLTAETMGNQSQNRSAGPKTRNMLGGIRDSLGLGGGTNGNADYGGGEDYEP